MSLLALVPMKEHSERVPRKNLRPIAGLPLFHWILNALSDSVGVDEIIVDTDSDEIEAAVTKSHPAVTIHRRPVELHGDEVPMHDIVAYVARHSSHDHVLQTHSTNPLLGATTVDLAIQAFSDRGPHDSLMGVTATQSRFFFADGRAVNHDPAKLLRTQDLEPLYEENSNIYIAPADLIRRTGLRIGSSPLLFPIERAESVDIDDQLDFDMAEWLLTRRYG